jgi:hypothetical protein
MKLRSPFGEHTIFGINNNEPYLRRIYMLPKRYSGAWWPGVFLHHFYKSDSDRFPHNHPWTWSISLVLKGGYREKRFNRKSGKWSVRTLLPFSFNIIRAEDFHRVELLDQTNGAWTLFVAFKHKRKHDGEEWGFLNTETDEFIGWKRYLGINSDGLQGD